jgi:hypothetical protein
VPLPRRQMFGRYDAERQAYLLSNVAPDGPVRFSLIFEDEENATAERVLASYLKRKRIDVRWHPPLTMERAAMLADATARLRSQVA